jgi:Zn-dependent M28 family amino/carboxypeptidase
VRFIAFGAEEQGLWGSFHHVRSNASALESAVAMINLDTVGAAMNGTRLLSVSPELADQAKASATQAGWVPDRVVEIATMPWFDHGPFAAAGIPACCLLQDVPTHPYYHTAGDDLRHLNLELSCLAVNANLAVISDLAR